MKKQILDALKAKFPGVSDAILGRIADKLAKTTTNEEDVATTVEGVTFQQVLENYGDSRATEATQTAVSNYEKKHGLKDGQKAQGGELKPEPKTEEDPETPAWAKALIESNKTLSDKLATLEGEKVTSSRQQKLTAIIGKLPENLQKPYARVSVKDMTDEEFEALATEITTEVDGLVADAKAKGAVFGTPTSGGGNIDTGKAPSKEEVEAVAKAMGL